MMATYETHELKKFLDERRMRKDTHKATMTGLPPHPGNWFISDEDYPKFFDILHDYLFVQGLLPRHLVEQPSIDGPKPLLIDLDFKFSPEKSLNRVIKLIHIHNFCHILKDCLNTFFQLECYDVVRFFILQRPSPYKDPKDKGLHKDGIHIELPDIALSNDKQKVIRKWMLEHNAVSTCFSAVDYYNKDDDIYDECMTRKQGWLLFGESKPTIPTYEVVNVYNYSPEGATWSEEPTTNYNNRELMELLSIRYNVSPDDNEVRPEAAELFQKLLDPAPLPTPSPAPEPMHPHILDSVVSSLFQASEDDKQMIRRLVLEALSVDRAERYETWIRVGWCLHNIEASEDLFNVWMDFSKKSSKAGSNNTSQLRRDWFIGMKKEGDGPRLTERSLHKWARDDNPEAYKKIKDDNLYEYIRSQVDPTHYHIAKLMKKMYGNNYIASISSRSTEWYFYDDAANMWKRLNQGIPLRMKISTEVAQKISEAMGTIRRDINNQNVSKETREVAEAKLKLLNKVEGSLYNSGFSDSVMKMATNLFYEDEFEHRLNVNPYLFGCRNGVLELRAKTAAKPEEHVIFRQGRPEDYVSFLAGQLYPEMDSIDYIPYNPNDQKQVEIEDFMSKLFPDDDLKRYMLRLLASCLEGTNREQCYYTWTGVGGNGKSKLVELMRMTFGDYQSSLQSTVLTRKRPESGAANPDMMAIKSKRFIYMQEPDDREPLNTSRMKQMSGEDIIEARPMYKDQEKFRVMGKIFLMCNRLPPIYSMDRGTWRRIRVIPFVSKFVDPESAELKEGRKNVFPIDRQLDAKLRSWREAMFSRLVHVYETEYLVTGLNPIPAVVEQASNQYKESFDTYAKFKSERLREPRNQEELLEARENPIKFAEIRRVFSKWIGSGKSLTVQELRDRLTEDYGSPSSDNKWDSFKVFDDDELVQMWDGAAGGAAEIEA
jgi:P4 family phage/plasmid primase-like protien